MLAKRTNYLKSSFVTQILKIAQNSQIISFAGGLPNSKFFPRTELSQAARWVLRHNASTALQYTGTQGFLPLRHWISSRYQETTGMLIDPNDIVIVSGAQQGIDLIAKLFLDPGDSVLVENPTFLGAIEAFAVYEPKYLTIHISPTGIDLEKFEKVLVTQKPKLIYLVPTFHNPTGYCYDQETRKIVAAHLKKYKHYLIEDDPYAELSFNNSPRVPVKAHASNNVFLIGSFSKSISPGIRLGWICSPKKFINKLLMLKQASDLHSNNFMQHVISKYLLLNDFDQQTKKVNNHYKMLAKHMHISLTKQLPKSVSFTTVHGGMFYWLTLPDTFSTTQLFSQAIAKNIAFVPGLPFFVDQSNDHCMRLNFTNSTREMITRGIKTLGEVIGETMQQSNR